MLKATVSIGVPFLLASCSAPAWVPFVGGPSDAYCACADSSGKYGPKGERCGETLKQKVGKQGYYGELEVVKSPAYFSKDCRAEP